MIGTYIMCSCQTGMHLIFGSNLNCIAYFADFATMKIYFIFFLIFSVLKLQSGDLIGERIDGDTILQTYSVHQKGGEKDFEGYIWGFLAKKGTRVDKVLNINLDKVNKITIYRNKTFIKFFISFFLDRWNSKRY